MNRRTFIAGSATVLALNPTFASVLAQDVLPESRWDEASQLFGNAWDVLPKAKEGEIELLSTIVSPAGSMFGMTDLFGLIHNNSDTEAGLVGLKYNDGDLFLMSSSFQQVIAPQGYALLIVSTTLGFSDAAEPPVLDATFGAAEEVRSRAYSTSMPLQIDSAEITDQGVNTSLTNATSYDVKEAGISGLVIWFDTNGAPINGATVGDLEGLPAEESYESESLIFSDFDPTALFLIGYFGDME